MSAAPPEYEDWKYDLSEKHSCILMQIFLCSPAAKP